MKRRELLGLFGTLPFLLASNIHPPKPTVPIQDLLLDLIKRDVKDDPNFSWMLASDSIKNPYIGPYSSRPVAIIVRNNIITVRTIGTESEQMQCMLQRDALFELVNAILSDTVILYTKENKEVAIIEPYYSDAKEIIRGGRYIFFQHIIVNYKLIDNTA